MGGIEFAFFIHPVKEYNWFKLSWDSNTHRRWLASFWKFNMSVIVPTTSNWYASIKRVAVVALAIIVGALVFGGLLWVRFKACMDVFNNMVYCLLR